MCIHVGVSHMINGIVYITNENNDVVKSFEKLCIVVHVVHVVHVGVRHSH